MTKFEPGGLTRMMIWVMGSESLAMVAVDEGGAVEEKRRRGG